MDSQKQPVPEDEKKRESGQPGGGAGRREDVHGSGVYPASGPLPESNAPYQGLASWGQGERGAAGYEDHGDSELINIKEFNPDEEGLAGPSPEEPSAENP